MDSKGINNIDEYFTSKSFTKKQYEELLEENKTLEENEKLQEQNAELSF